MANARRIIVSTAALLALLSLAVPAGAVKARATAISAANPLEHRVLAQVNAVRARHGLRPLRPSAPLRAAAEVHSHQMARLGFFSHSSPDGSPFWRRVKRHYRTSGYRFWSVGENLLWASPEIDAAEAVRRWMRSPAHRANLLTARWREIGLAAVRSPSAPNAFRGLDVTIVTAEFGVRR